MKKILSICLVLMMCALAASAEAVWADGLSSKKPYSGSPEVDFSETIGYMMLDPLAGENIMPGMVTLKIYMPRVDVEIGEGMLKLKNNEDDVVYEINASEMVLRKMNEGELKALMWGEGVVFEAAIPEALKANYSYYVEIDEGFIKAPVYETVNPAISGKDTWAFTTTTASYVEDLVFTRKVEGEEEPVVVEEVQAGDTAKLSVVIGENAASAAIFCNVGSINPAATYFEETTEVTIDFPAVGDVEWGVVFMDADGKVVYSMDFVTAVAPLVVE